jgi:hypothetical protein
LSFLLPTPESLLQGSSLLRTPGVTSLGVFLFRYPDAAGEGGAGGEFGGGRVTDLFEGQAVRRYDPDGRVPDRGR